MCAHHITTHRSGCLASVTASFQGTKDTLGESFCWQQATKDTKDTYHRVSQAPPMPPPLYPAEGSIKTTTVCISENRTTVPAASADITSQEITLHFPSPAQPFFSGLWPTCRRNAGLRPQHSPWRPPTLKHGTGGAIHELPRAETKPINFHYCHGSPRALHPLQPTGYSAIFPP